MDKRVLHWTEDVSNTPGEVELLESIVSRICCYSDVMTPNGILRCQQFDLYNSPSLSRLLPRAKFVRLSDQCVRWLGEDGITFGQCQEFVGGRFEKYQDDNSDWDSTSWNSDYNSEVSTDDIPPSVKSVNSKTKDSNQQPPPPPPFSHTEEFSGLIRQIDSIITNLGGRVFPKLNWSCPKDAKWMLGGRLACESPT